MAAGKTADQTLEAFDAPKPTAAPLFANYSAPTGSAMLPLSKVESIAKDIAANYAGDSSPESIRSVLNTPLKSAFTVAGPAANPPQTVSAGMAAWEQSSTDVITMEGSFSLAAAPHPNGDREPEGQVLSVVIDAYTGEVAAISLGGIKPDLADLGTVHQLG